MNSTDVDAHVAEAIMLSSEVSLSLAWCPPGTFMMGSPESEPDRQDNESEHRVTLALGFSMGRFTVTKRQWKAVMGTTPWVGQNNVIDHPESPAVYVSWDDAQEFLAELNHHIEQTGQGPGNVRLPSEAEWEYAARAGTKTRFYWGDDPSYTQINEYAWWRGNAYDVGHQYAHVVGQKLPNAWGLYDMSGNVWEWCEDDWHPDYDGAPTDGSAWVHTPRGPNRISRGGGWDNFGGFDCRSAYRIHCPPDFRYYNGGFRIVR